MAVEETEESSHEQPERPELDIDRVEPDDGPYRVLKRINDSRGAGFIPVIQRTALDAIHTHGKTDTSVEICGVLVGRVQHDRKGPYLLIEASIAGEKSANKQTQVTFTAETWNSIQQEMEKKYPDKKIVGWYHTHPGFGVFLSGMDLFIQDNFFNLPWQVAWVYDPIADIDGAFVWKSGKSVKADFLIEENDGERGYDFRKAREETSTRRRFIGETRTNTAGILRFVVVFMLFFLICWFVLHLLSQRGYQIRWPIGR